MNRDTLKCRRAVAEDMPAVYLLGYDTWSDGQSVEEHIATCQASKKYEQGTWYVLEHHGEPVSALICYRSAFGLAEGLVGIGSVATAPSHRLQGFASQLIRAVMARFAVDAPVDGYFLYSDVDPVVYEKLGFVRLPTQHQRYEKSVAMVCPATKSVRAILGTDFTAPYYF